MIPIYESPDRSGLQPMGRAPRGWTEQIGAAWEAQRWVENVNQERRSDLDLYSRRIDEVREATGVRLDHPLLIHDPRERRLEGSRIERFEARIAELRTGNPEYATAIRSREDWEAERRARIQEIAADAEGLEFVPALVGGVLGSFEDPLNLATLPIGGGKNIVTVAAREAGVNALVEGASLPAAQRWRQEMGLAELTGDEMAFRVGVGAVFGAVAGGGGRALEIGWNRLPLNRQAEALRELAPESAEARGLADLLEREAEIEASNPLAPGVENAALERALDIAVPREEVSSRRSRLLSSGADGSPAPVSLPAGREFDSAYSSTIVDQISREEFVIEQIQRRLARDADPAALERAVIERLDPYSGARLRDIDTELGGAISGKRRHALTAEREGIAEGFSEEVSQAAVRRQQDAADLQDRLAAARVRLRDLNQELRRVARKVSEPEAQALHRDMFDWAAEASRRGDMSPDNPYRTIETPPARAAADGDLFDDVSGAGPRDQLAQLEAEQRAYAAAADEDMIPTGRIIDDQPEMTSRAEIEADLDRQQSLLSALRTCSLGGGGS